MVSSYIYCVISLFNFVLLAVILVSFYVKYIKCQYIGITLDVMQMEQRKSLRRFNALSKDEKENEDRINLLLFIIAIPIMFTKLISS